MFKMATFAVINLVLFFGAAIYVVRGIIGHEYAVAVISLVLTVLFGISFIDRLKEIQAKHISSRK